MDGTQDINVTPLRRVVRTARSPMNNHQWCLELECGHDAWVTAKRQPRRTVFGCEKCRSTFKVV